MSNLNLSTMIEALKAAGIPTENMTEAQIVAIHNTIGTAVTVATKKNLQEQIAAINTETADKIRNIKMSNTQKAVLAAKTKAADATKVLINELDKLQQEETLEAGQKIGTAIKSSLSKVDEALIKVPGVSKAKGLFRGITGAFKS